VPIYALAAAKINAAYWPVVSQIVAEIFDLARFGPKPVVHLFRIVIG
jgi:hypothetical protein